MEELKNTVLIRTWPNGTVDFSIKVPRNFNLNIKAINNGDIYVEDVSGEFEVSNVNGSITMENISGPVLADAMNKDIKIDFRSVGDGHMAFSNFNGDIDISFEFFPPKTEKMAQTLQDSVATLQPLGPRFVSVTYGAGGTTRERTHAEVVRVQNETNIPAAAHLTCVNATKDEVNAVARHYWESGIRHIVALRGDAPDGAAYTPHPGGYANAVELIAGLKEVADFEISVAAYPEVHPDSPDAQTDIANLKAKFDAGADRAITQFFFDPECFFRFRDEAAAAGIDAEIVPGVMPARMPSFASITAAEAAEIAAFRILDAGDRVGGIVFDNDSHVELVPKRSRRTAYALLEAIAEKNAGLHADRPAKPAPGELNAVLNSVARIAHHDHLVFVFSDFDGIDEVTQRHLSGIATHNDVVLFLVYDPISERIEPGERAVIGDSHMQAEIDLGSKPVRDAVNEFTRQRLEKIHRWQTEINLSVLPLSSGEETLPQIRRLMGGLSPRRRVR
mgnify:CR=1 FL=1